MRDLIQYLLVVFVLFGAIGMLIGQKKGRRMAGLLWSMALGPIGWLIVWFGPDLSATASAPARR